MLFGMAGGIYPSIAEVDRHFREETPEETAAYFQYVANREPPRLPSSTGEPGPLAPIIPRVDKLVSDFQGRMLPKMEEILHSLAATTRAWVSG